MLKMKGLDKLIKGFSSSFDGIADNYLLRTAKNLRKKAVGKMAQVSGEMVKQTTAYSDRVGTATVGVNVVYASYQEKGQRADGSRVIKNRTPPGQKDALKKSAQELDLNSEVYVILEDLSKKLL